MPRFNKQSARKPKYGGAKSRPTRRRSKSGSGSDPHSVRLQKVLAAAGVGSRRQCEEMITEGRVEVDGQTVTELGTKVDPARQQIRVDSELLRRPKRMYYLINKPLGVVCTSSDPTGRLRVIDLVPTHERLFTIGRLDKSSEGLILATNDGELTDLLTHPRYGVEKTYLALVAGAPTHEALEKLRRGVRLAEGYAHAKRVHVRKKYHRSAVLEIVLDEGRNREVRRLLARAGHKVMKLRRIAIGPLRLADLEPGEHRPLKREEVEELYQVAREGRKAERKPKAGKLAQPTLPDHEPKVTPLIDESVPMSDADDTSWLVAGDDDLASFTEPADFNAEPFDEPAPDEQDHELLAAEVAQRRGRSRRDLETGPTAKVDHSPIVIGQQRNAGRGKVIGGGGGRRAEKPRGANPRGAKSRGGTGKFQNQKKSTQQKSSRPKPGGKRQTEARGDGRSRARGAGPKS